MNVTVSTLSLGPSTTSGTVKWFSPEKGYGFVIVSGFEEDFLLHENVLRNFGRTTISEGSKVSFAYDATDKGYKIT